jgi:hypothetical protein
MAGAHSMAQLDVVDLRANPVSARELGVGMSSFSLPVFISNLAIDRNHRREMRSSAIAVIGPHYRA